MDNSGYEIIYPRGGSRRVVPRRLRPFLVPATWLYGAAADTARRLRETERRATPADVTVISVGNLEVGGSGKTPLCICLLEELSARGHPVAYVSRGFNSRSERFDGVTVLGKSPAGAGGVRWLSRDNPRLSREIGDEGAVVADRVPSARLAFSRDKARAVDLVAPSVEGGYIVLDDAFQSWGVGRDVDVVLLDPGRPFGNGWMLPAGTLREEPAALARADVVVFNGGMEGEAMAAACSRIRRIAGREVPCGVMKREVDPGVASDEPVVAASAIARAEAFERSLLACGVTIEASLRFPDHHRYTIEDTERIAAVCARRRCVVTEKDWVKLRELGCDASAFAVARLDARVDPATLSAIIKREPRRGRGSR